MDITFSTISDAVSPINSDLSERLNGLKHGLADSLAPLRDALNTAASSVTLPDLSGIKNAVAHINNEVSNRPAAW